MSTESVLTPQPAVSDTAQPDVGGLRPIVLTSLEPLFLRLHATLVDHLILEMETAVGEATLGFKPPAGIRADRMAAILAAVHAANRSRQRVNEWRAGLDMLRKRVLDLTVQEEAATLITQFLGTLGISGRDLADDRKALNRYFDLDAIEERVSRLVAHEWNLQEIAIRAVGALLADESRQLVRVRDAPPERYRFLFDQTGAILFLKAYVNEDRAWRLAAASLQAIGMVVRVLPGKIWSEQIDPDLFQTVYRMGLNDEANVWVQRAALRALLDFDLAEAFSVYARRLEEGANRRDDDIFVRRMIVDVLGLHVDEDEALNLLRGVITRPDASEHVRVGAAQSLVRFSFRLYGPVVEAVLGLKEDREPDPCQQVRTAAVLAIMRRTAPGGLDSERNRWILSTCVRALELDPDALFTRALLEEMPAFAQELSGPGVDICAAAHELLAAIDRLIAKPRLSLLLLRAAQESREAIIVPRLPQYRTVHSRLSDAMENLGEGDRLTLPTTELGVDAPTLGRILAFMARSDFGYFAEVRANVTRIQKGDRFGTTLWRLFHELLHPRSGKRQAFFHSVGRRTFGHIRAHPLLMGELVETNVPGERCFAEAEGQWRRYLPLVDDCFTLTQGLGAPVKVQLFSAQGITTLTGPKGLWRKMKLFFGLTFRYASLGALRNQSATRDNLRPVRRYLDALRSAGVEVSFTPHAYIYGGSFLQLSDPTLDEIFWSPTGEGPAFSGEGSPGANRADSTARSG
jgi:hypothetical protein